MTFLEILKTIEKIRKRSQAMAANKLEKMPSEVQEKVKERDLKSQAEASEDWNALVAQVRKEHGEIYVDLLKKTAAGYGLAHVMENAQALDTSVSSSKLYQKVLPLCKLAYQFEQNGDAKEHAAKIALIFNDELAVLTWLLKYGNKIKDRGPLVHEACLFDLPAPKDCDFKYWKKLANEGDNMLTPSFRTLLSHAPVIERFIVLEAQAKPKNSREYDRKAAIEAAEHAVSLATTRYRKKKREPFDTLSADEKLTRIEALKDLAVKKLEANLALAEACRGIPLRQLSVSKLQAYYEIKSVKSHKILVDNGVSDKGIRLFDALERRNDDKAIPNVFINGKEIGYTGVYLKKLDILSDQGAAIAACLGLMRKIDCCQYLGSSGESCTMHGISSPNGGFYVLCKGNAEEPKIEDEILAASWVWNSERGALCLDSVESQHRDRDTLNLITDMYRYASHTLCHHPQPGQRPITHINTGARSGVSEEVSLKDYPAPHEHFRDYVGYTDAKSQRMLANSSMPYLFYGQVKSIAFQEIIKKQSEDFFNVIFQNAGFLKDSEPLKRAIAFALHSNNNKLIALLETSAGEHLEELRSLININLGYIENLSNYIIDFDALSKGAYLNAMSITGQSALHIATQLGNAVDVRRLIDSDINIDIGYKDPSGQTILHYSADNPECLQIVLTLIPEKQRLEVLKVADENGWMALLLAARNPECLRIVLALIPEKQRLKALKMADPQGSTLPHYVAIDPKSLELLFTLVPKEQILDTLWLPNDCEQTVLHWAARNSESLKLLLAIIPDEQRLKAVYMVVTLFKNIRNYSANSHKSLKILLALIPEEQRLEAIKVVNPTGGRETTMLHLVANNPKCLQVIFKLIPKEQRFDAINLANKQRLSVWHCLSIDKPESLKIVLALIPEEKRLSAVRIKQWLGKTALHFLEDNPEYLKIVLALIPEEQRLEALKVVDPSGYNVLHLVADKPKSLRVIFTLIPKEQRLNALELTDKFGQTVRDKAIKNPESMKVIQALGLAPKPVSANAFFQSAQPSEPSSLKATIPKAW